MTTLTREDWGATAPLYFPMTLPARGVFVHHSVTEATDEDAIVEATDDPVADMQAIERIGVERFGRFSYSWAFHPNGTVLEGAGLTIGAHTSGHNSRYFAFVLIGNYENHRPTGPQLAAMAAKYRELVADGLLVGGAEYRPHRSVKATACPGRHMVAALPELRRLTLTPRETPEVITDADIEKIARAVERKVLNHLEFRDKVHWNPARRILDAIAASSLSRGKAASFAGLPRMEEVTGGDSEVI